MIPPSHKTVDLHFAIKTSSEDIDHKIIRLIRLKEKLVGLQAYEDVVFIDSKLKAVKDLIEVQHNWKKTLPEIEDKNANDR